jgi:hypothetical protein
MIAVLPEPGATPSQASLSAIANVKFVLHEIT